MQAFHLCVSCASRFPKSPLLTPAKEEHECHICKGVLAAISTMVSSVISQSSSFEWNTFSVSSSFPKAVFIREQSIADYFPPDKFTSIKNTANSELAHRIEGGTGKKNDSRHPDITFEFDFKSLSGAAKPLPLYIFGHYLKLSRKHCQSRWHCSICRGRGCDSCGGSGHNYPSVEEELGKTLSVAFCSSLCTLHASGREDVDVRMLGGGRPFVMEIRSPAKRSADLSLVEKELSKNESVRAIGLQCVGKHFLDAVCNSHFEKEYSALVSADRPLSAKDARAAESLSGKTIFQQTPMRVLSRRTDMERRRKIISIRTESCKDGKLRMRILAEAGTYIKELINSDKGRTKPSLSELLGCKAVCEELDVVNICDYYLQTVSD